MKQYRLPIIILEVFETVAVTLWLTKDNLFYLFNFSSLIRIKCDKEKCISCGKCKRVCPMNVDVTDNSRRRENGTECILCMECVKNCPKNAL